MTSAISAITSAMTSVTSSVNDKNENEEDEDITCPICLDILFVPVTTVCGHTFCQECVKRVGPVFRTKCPLCRGQTGRVKTNKKMEMDILVKKFNDQEYRKRYDEAKTKIINDENRKIQYQRISLQIKRKKLEAEMGKLIKSEMNLINRIGKLEGQYKRKEEKIMKKRKHQEQEQEQRQREREQQKLLEQQKKSKRQQIELKEKKEEKEQPVKKKCKAQQPTKSLKSIKIRFSNETKLTNMAKRIASIARLSD